MNKLKMIRNKEGKIVRDNTQELPEFSIKGELIEVLNLTDTFKKIRDITRHKDVHKFLFVTNKREVISHWDLDRVSVEDESFPIQVIKILRKFDTEEEIFNEE